MARTKKQKGATGLVLYKSPNTKPVKITGIFDLTKNNTRLSLSHVDMFKGKNYGDDPAAYLDDFVTPNLTSVFWGTRQFAQLYQYYKILKISYQYIPAVAFTWTGTVAVKIADDPLDETYVENINQFVNAPSSMIVPVYAPSATMTYYPRAQKKYCYGTISLTKEGTETFPLAGVNIVEFQQARLEGYGNMRMVPFDVLDASGNPVGGDVVYGRLMITLEMVYDTPVPIDQARVAKEVIKEVELTPIGP